MINIKHNDKTSYELAYSRAELYNKTLKATNPGFNRATTIKHEDGSYLFFMNSFACNYSFAHNEQQCEYIIVYTEHFGFHIFSKDEVEVTMLDNCRKYIEIEPLGVI